MEESTSRSPYPMPTVSGLPLDDNRGIWGMWTLILTEGMLFVCFFGAYFYLENNKNRFAIDMPPHTHWAVSAAALLIVSSIAMWLGERQIFRRNYFAGRMLLLVVLVLGLGFLALEGFDFALEWRTLTPYSDSYGSIFYTIIGFDALHVIIGMLILLYVLVLPRYSMERISPHRPYHVAALYWYFVTVVWIFIVGLLYVMPNIRIYGF
jgi:heme/copper-type cytochrome/quinol oxidase subunit 3